MELNSSVPGYGRKRFVEVCTLAFTVNVQVTQIQQRTVGKTVNLEMVFMGRTTLDALNFLRNLGNSKNFRDLVVSQEGSFRDAATHRVTNEVEVVLHMDYVPWAVTRR